MAKNIFPPAQNHANLRTDYSYCDPNRPTASATADGTLVALRTDITRRTQTVRAKVVAICQATRANNGFHQQVTVEFAHVAGPVHGGSPRTARYSMRETLAVNKARAPLACGQYIELTYTYMVDPRMQPHSIEWQKVAVV